MPEQLALENARLLSQAYGSESLVAEVDRGEETLRLASQPDKALLAKLVLLTRLERETEYRTSIYGSADQLHFFGKHHFLHWSDPERVLTDLC